MFIDEACSTPSDPNIFAHVLIIVGTIRWVARFQTYTCQTCYLYIIGSSSIFVSDR